MLQIVQTADGSNTIYNPEVGEHYHSTNGALQESQHVFLDTGLKYFLDKQKVAEVSILEVGFGTGLNFLLSANLCTEQQINLNYTGIEAYPLTQEMMGQTAYDQFIQADLWTSFINSYQNTLIQPIVLNTYCQVEITALKLKAFQSLKQYDIIYFDAFASARQPEMWDDEAINHTIQFLKPGGVFVTYAITGNLKRALKALGCKVEKAPGALGKREMLRAVKL